MSEAKVLSIRDFISESEAFPFSKEYFDLLKMESEVTIMGQYIQAQHYLKEHGAALVESVGAEFLMESAAADTLKGVQQQFAEKYELFVESAAKRFDKIIAGIKAFFRSIMAKVSATQKKCEEALTRLNSKELTDGDKETLKGIVMSAEKASGLNISSTKNPGGGLGKMMPTGHGSVGDALAAAIKNDTITVDLGDSTANALNESDLTSIVDDIANNNFDAALKRFPENRKAVTIPSNSQKIMDLANKLDQIKLDAKDDLKAKKKTDAEVGSDLLKLRAELATKFQQSIAHTMKLYVSVEKFRHTVASGILKSIKVTATSKEGSKADEKAGTPAPAPA